MCDVRIVVWPAVGTPVANESVSGGFSAVEIMHVFIQRDSAHGESAKIENRL